MLAKEGRTLSHSPNNRYARSNSFGFTLPGIMTAISSAALESPPHPARADRLERMTPSAIRAVHNLGEALRLERPDGRFISLHFGEGDQGTPDFIVNAATEALRGGAVFYENNAGRPDLLEALSGHYTARMRVPLEPGNFVVTCGGVQAIHLTMLGLLAPGDSIINITPAWPNFREAAVIAGAEVSDLPLTFDETGHVFRLDFDALATRAAEARNLRMVVVNTPSNPTGFVMSAEDKDRLLTFCRDRSLWLLADEMYDRLVFDEPRSPSFLEVNGKTGGGELGTLVVVNGFSKTYALTGWRLGYLVANPDLASRLAQMQEFVTSCAPAATQVAAVAALKEGERYVEKSHARYLFLRDRILAGLERIPGVTVARPQGAFYAWFRAPGTEDSLAFCSDLLQGRELLLAPGCAFGEGGEGWVRMCFAKAPEVLDEALERLDNYLNG